MCPVRLAGSSTEDIATPQPFLTGDTPALETRDCLVTLSIIQAQYAPLRYDAASGAYLPWAAGSKVDGILSQVVPAGTRRAAVYVAGMFNTNLITWPAGTTETQMLAAQGGMVQYRRPLWSDKRIAGDDLVVPGGGTPPPVVVPGASILGGNEANEGQNLTFQISLGQATTVDLTIGLAYSGTAGRGSDYTGPDNVTIPSGQLTATLTLPTLSDGEVEGPESVVVTLQPGIGYTVATASATGTINSQDTYPQASLSGSPSAVEGSPLVFVAALSKAASSAITVPITYGGTAPSVDYSGPASVTFPAGSTSSNVTVTTVGNTAVDGNRTVIATLGSGTGYTLGTASATGTITDDDVASTPDGPAEDVITPAVSTKRSSYALTKQGVIQPIPAWMTTGNGVYWGDQVKAPSNAYPDRRFNYFSTDHDESTGGISITVCVSDPSVLANWKVYDDAVDAGWLADIPNLPAKGGPIFTGFGGAGNQYETPCVNKVGNEFLMTYQATNVPNARNQATLMAVSPNGVSNWTGTHTALMQVPSSEVIGDGHHGYMKWGPNPFPRDTVPYDYVGYSLVGGQSRSTQGMWGSNAPKTTWVFLGGVGKWSGRNTPTNRFGTNTDRYKLAATAIDVKSIKLTRQGYVGMGEFAGVGSGATARPGAMYEFMLAANGKQMIGRPQLVIPQGASGAYDEGEAATGSVLTFASKSIIVYNGATSANRKTGVLATSPLRNTQNVWFNTPSPAIPPASKITTKAFDFRGLTALPAGLTAVAAGTTPAAPTFSANGLTVTVDGTMATKGEYQVFENDGFDPLTTEYVDIIIEGWATTSTTAYRWPYIGFTTKKDVRANFTDAVLIGNGEGTVGTLGYQVVAASAQPVAAGVSEDYWGVGYGTASIDTMANPKKMVGVRIYPKDNLAYILGEGGVEQQEFKSGTSAMMGAFDKTQRWYPFFGFKGVDTAAATERVAKMTVRVSAPVKASDAATLGTVATNQTSTNTQTPSFGAIALGAAASNRTVAFFVSGRTTGDISLVATFTPEGGSAISLTLVKIHKSTYDSPNVTFMALFVGAIPTATTGVLNVTATGTTVVRWGCKTVPMYGAKLLPDDTGEASLAGVNTLVDIGINKFEGGITALATIHSTSGSTLHNHAAEEVLFDSMSQEISVFPQSNAAYQVIGVRNVGASSTSMEATNSAGQATLIASWKKATAS